MYYGLHIESECRTRSGKHISKSVCNFWFPTETERDAYAVKSMKGNTKLRTVTIEKR